MEDMTTRSRWRDWLFGQALPLWNTAGFDPSRSLYHERLTWDASPVTMDALRLMVQARQISTFCRAALDGVFDAGEQALACLDKVKQLFHCADGQSGWVFSVASNDRPADTKRDLYAHAFILFAFGWAIRYANRSEDRLMARLIADEIDQIFTAPNGGYFDSIPDNGSLRSQNPHMHLLEAYLVVFESTGDAFYLGKAKALVELARTHLIDRRSGLLLEFFRPDWGLLKESGHNQVQPGHLFEWSWLLHDYTRLSNSDQDETHPLVQHAEALFKAGFTYGCDHGRYVVLDSMTDNHVVLESSARIWAQTELLRLLHTGCVMPNHADDARFFAGSFLDHFAPSALRGGWIDHINAEGRKLVDYMPASSLYHIYGAGRQIVLGS